MFSKLSNKVLSVILIIIIQISLQISPISTEDVNDDPVVNINNENTSPIIGILAQETVESISKEYPKSKYSSYIAASYVKFIEGAGGRVVPIWLHRSDDYYEDIMNKINGVLLPGDKELFNETKNYIAAGKELYQIAIKKNKHGIFMPIWGTSLGFELLIYLSADETDFRTRCDFSSLPLPLELKEVFSRSRLFQNASAEIINILKTYPVTANFHIYCIKQETFSKKQLRKFWTVLSTNHDRNDNEFISIIEHVTYPFYAVKFHPEKNIYEFSTNRNITHISVAIRCSQYFANFFVDQARVNKQSFAIKSEESKALIYNWKPEYIHIAGTEFIQKYLFQEKSDYSGSEKQKLNNASKISLSILFMTISHYYTQKFFLL